MRPIHFFQWVIVLGLFVHSAIFAANDGQADLDAHQHGHGTMNVVQEGNDIFIEIEIPGVNVVGFEGIAESSEQKEAVESALAQLSKARELFTPDVDGKCEFDTGSIDVHAPEADGEHSEFEASYRMTCESPDALSEIVVNLFDHLKDMDELDVQLVTSTGQTRVELTDKDRSLSLE